MTAAMVVPRRLCRSLARRLHLAPPFLVFDYQPAATTLPQSAADEKLKRAEDELRDCRACPRNCGVNRLEGRLGICNTGTLPIVSTAFPHFGEESVIQGWRGSGTIFFGMCNLRCVFCQNWDISQQKYGKEMSPKEIAQLMIALQDEAKCHNINFVTPEHVAPQVAQSIIIARDLGLNVPVVYNTSSYDSMSSLELLDGLVDIYLADFKFWSGETSQHLCKSRDYPEVAKKSIKAMHAQVGDLVFDESGLAKRGVLLRHLVMPGLTEEAEQILQWVASHLSRDTYVNIMEQYHPDHKVGVGERRAGSGFTRYEHINRPVSPEEVGHVRRFAREEARLWRFEHDNHR